MEPIGHPAKKQGSLLGREESSLFSRNNLAVKLEQVVLASMAYKVRDRFCRKKLKKKRTDD